MTCYWCSREGCDCKQPERADPASYAAYEDRLESAALRAQQGKLHTKVVWDEAADLERLWPKPEDMVDCLQDRITPAVATVDVVLPLREDVIEALSEPAQRVCAGCGSEAAPAFTVTDRLGHERIACSGDCAQKLVLLLKARYECFPREDVPPTIKVTPHAQLPPKTSVDRPVRSLDEVETHDWLVDYADPRNNRCSHCGHRPCPVHEPYSYGRWLGRKDR
jgi:hypothetical protein